MARYIDSDRTLKNLPDDLSYKASVKRVLMQAPEADVAEVRHGEWKFVNQSTNYLEEPYGDTYACSNCNCEVDVSEMPYNYCPHCGAKMDKGVIA